MAGEKRRVLGDEWEGWDGRIEDSSATKWLAIGLSWIFLILFDAFVFAAYYLISPRLELLSSFLNSLIWYAICFSLGVVFILQVLFSIALLINIPFIGGLLNKYGRIILFSPMMVSIAKRLGIRQDRFFHSVILINNHFILNYFKRNFKSPLVLLPRCLTKDIMVMIREYFDSMSIPVYIVAGGSLARKIVKENKPDFIIAIACERDLFWGVGDIGSIPAFAIMNMRPNGPCLDTIIDREDFLYSMNIILKRFKR